MTFQEIYKLDQFANDAGVRLISLGEEGAVMELKVEARHLNAGATAHGGAIFLLTDITMAAMANFRQLGSVSIQSDIRFLGAALEGDTLTAHATEVFGRKSLYNSRVVVTNQNGDMIAISEGLYYVKKSFQLAAEQ
ncbi:MAG: PaaI family thioesterase [Rikenellaceae bacterium]